MDSTGVVMQEHPWMETYLGVKFKPTQPKVEDIDLLDIAHALSMQCRYAGHVKQFYSVAEHSVRVSLIMSPENALWGLLHDAAEAYLQDMIRPLKCLPALGGEYRKLEDQMTTAIAARFGLQFPIPDEVKWADNTLLFTEKRDLRLRDLKWQDQDKYPPLPEVIKTWTWQEARVKFLMRFEELTGSQFEQWRADSIDR